MRTIGRVGMLFLRSTLTLFGLMAAIVLPIAALFGYWYWISETLIDSTPSHPLIGFPLIFLPLVIGAMVTLAHEDRQAGRKAGEGRSRI